MKGRLGRLLGRISVRLLVVNLLVLFVPALGLEFARAHERQLLVSLERDMKNQARLVAAVIEADVADGGELGGAQRQAVLENAARTTRTRIRVLDATGATVADSHAAGPPEGPEPPPPSMLPRRDRQAAAADGVDSGPRWPEVPDRPEVRAALTGSPAGMTRLRDRQPGVLLFVAEPIRSKGTVAGAVYVTRSTQPVLTELYRIRSSLVRVLFVALLLTAAVTLVLAWSISRPLSRLSAAAKRVAAGERDVPLPAGGGGEIAELAESFRSMRDRLDARLRYISDFSADVAHEFKSPLTSIRGAAELLGEGAADDPQARARFLRNIELDVARLDRLVSRLLELSRIEASEALPEPIDLSVVLARVADRAATPDQTVALTLAVRDPVLWARETDLETAVSNLVDNALRFSPPGEVVDLVAEDGGADRVRIVVRDRGPGIRETDLPKIFDRFFTTDADRDGTGLGLAIVKSVAEAHGGSVHAESAPGKGATFVLELPVRPGLRGVGRPRGGSPPPSRPSAA